MSLSSLVVSGNGLVGLERGDLLPGLAQLEQDLLGVLTHRGSAAQPAVAASHARRAGDRVSGLAGVVKLDDPFVGLGLRILDDLQRALDRCPGPVEPGQPVTPFAEAGLGEYGIQLRDAGRRVLRVMPFVGETWSESVIPNV